MGSALTADAHVMSGLAPAASGLGAGLGAFWSTSCTQSLADISLEALTAVDFVPSCPAGMRSLKTLDIMQYLPWAGK